MIFGPIVHALETREDRYNLRLRLALINGVAKATKDQTSGAVNQTRVQGSMQICMRKVLQVPNSFENFRNFSRLLGKVRIKYLT